MPLAVRFTLGLEAGRAKLEGLALCCARPAHRAAPPGVEVGRERILSTDARSEKAADDSDREPRIMAFTRPWLLRSAHRRFAPVGKYLESQGRRRGLAVRRTASCQVHGSPTGLRASDYEFWLDRILDGMERMAYRQAGERPPRPGNRSRRRRPPSPITETTVCARCGQPVEGNASRRCRWRTRNRSPGGVSR